MAAIHRHAIRVNMSKVSCDMECMYRASTVHRFILVVT